MIRLSPSLSVVFGYLSVIILYPTIVSSQQSYSWPLYGQGKLPVQSGTKVSKLHQHDDQHDASENLTLHYHIHAGLSRRASREIDID